MNPILLITRPKPHGPALCESLHAHGIMSVYFQTMIIAPCHTDPTTCAPYLKNAHMLIFISPHAAFFASDIVKGFYTPNQKIIAIGEGTALALAQNKLSVDVLPDQYNTNGLLAHPALQSVNNKNIVIIRGRGGKETLGQTLEKRGALVHYLEVYERLPAKNKMTQAILEKIDWILMTSEENFRYLLMQTPVILQPLLRTKPLLTSSQELKIIGIKAGFQVLPLLDSASMNDIVNYFI